MNKLAIVCATWPEVEPTLHFLREYQGLQADTFFYGKLQIVFCITGAGMVPTAFELGRIFQANISLAVNAGVAGSFGKFSIGDVVNVTSDRFTELGAEDGEAFLSIDELGLGRQLMELRRPLENAYVDRIPKAAGITVNTVHGHQPSIDRLLKRTSADVESMEGAAFIYAANAMGWHAVQLRAISNIVERRNRESWNLQLAIDNLNERLIGLLRFLNQ